MQPLASAVIVRGVFAFWGLLLLFLSRLPAILLVLLAQHVVVPARAETVTVFAAASLKNALDAVADGWQAETGNTVTIAYAGSSQLAKQIIAGAPASLFLSASPEWSDAVVKEGLVAQGGQKDLLANTLVLVAHQADGAVTAPLTDLKELNNRLGQGKLAMAFVDSVPAGQYGKAALTALGLWDALSPSVVQTDNVRSALALVSLGEAPFGIVYETDAAAVGNVVIVARFPEGSHPRIVYPALLLKDGATPTARAFFDALSGDTAKAVFRQHGFRTME